MPNCGLAASQLTASCPIEPTSPEAFRRVPRAPEMIWGAPTGLGGKGNQRMSSPASGDLHGLFSELKAVEGGSGVERAEGVACPVQRGVGCPGQV